MANALYDTGRNAFALGAINWVADDIRIVLIDTALYTVNLATDTFLDIVPAGARVATATASLANKSAVAGVVDADNYTFPSLSGATIEALILVRYTGVDATSQLIAYYDDAVGLVFSPNGSDVLVAWSDGSDRIFKL